MSHYAFDWGEVLENKPAMWEIARALAAAGHQVSIVSWCGENDGPKSAEGRKRITDSGIPWKYLVGFCAAPEVTLAVNPDGKAEFQIGQAKAQQMALIGATVLFDDNPYICDAVQKAGFQALRVYRS